MGKSCILSRLIKQQCNEDHNVTIGVEFGNYLMQINDYHFMKLQIWDTAGQESFRSITRIFYKGSHAALVVFDITDERTFNHLPDWKQEIVDNAEDGILVYLVGNFYDKQGERKIST